MRNEVVGRSGRGRTNQISRPPGPTISLRPKIAKRMPGEGRRAEGRKQKAEGRKQKAESRRQKAAGCGPEHRSIGAEEQRDRGGDGENEELKIEN